MVCPLGHSTQMLRYNKPTKSDLKTLTDIACYFLLHNDEKQWPQYEARAALIKLMYVFLSALKEFIS